MMRGILWPIILMAAAAGPVASGIESWSNITAEVLKSEPWEGTETAGVFLTFRITRSENVGNYGNLIRAGDVAGELFDGRDIGSTPLLADMREGDVFTASVSMAYDNGRRWNMTDVRIIKNGKEPALADGTPTEPSRGKQEDAPHVAGANPVGFPALLGIATGLAVLSLVFFKLMKKARN